MMTILKLIIVKKLPEIGIGFRDMVKFIMSMLGNPGLSYAYWNHL